MDPEQYCKAFRMWANVIRDQCPDCINLIDALDVVELAVTKSNLLYRLIYMGEELRTRQCPIHKGVWHGIPTAGNECECDLTGWLPNETIQNL